MHAIGTRIVLTMAAAVVFAVCPSSAFSACSSCQRQAAAPAYPAQTYQAPAYAPQAYAPTTPYAYPAMTPQAAPAPPQVIIIQPQAQHQMPAQLPSDPYSAHFGAGFYRSGAESGHHRFPYYSYRRPWYFPGHATYNRNTTLVW